MQGDRLKQIRSKFGLTQAELGKKIGLTQPQIKNIETGIQKLTAEIAENIANNLAINGWWLLTGKGSMKVEENIHYNVSNDTLLIPLISGHAQAGKGNDITGIRYEIVENMQISKSFFKTPPNGSIRVIKVDGYSMVPMLYPDTYVIFDECGEFKTDGLYIINYDDQLMVKLVQIDPQGKLYIKSTNPEYQSWTIDIGSQTIFKIIGKVLRVII